MRQYKIKSYAKINLALNILGKNHSLHKIESVITFSELHDVIRIKRITGKEHKIDFIGKFSTNIYSNNSISQLLSILEKKKLLNDKFQITVKKNIPSQAGLGGGSMNAANIFNFLIQKKLIRVKNKEVVKISNAVGFDTILGLYSKSLILKSNRLIKTFKIKKKLFILIVKPNFGCSTKKIYSYVKSYSISQLNRPSKEMFNLPFLKKMKNDLEPIVLKNYPKLKRLKNFLEKLSNIEFVRMTGSGSALIGYFKTGKKCKEAEKKVKKQFRNYWCKISKTI